MTSDRDEITEAVTEVTDRYDVVWSRREGDPNAWTSSGIDSRTYDELATERGPLHWTKPRRRRAPKLNNPAGVAEALAVLGAALESNRIVSAGANFAVEAAVLEMDRRGLLSTPTHP